MYQFEHTEFLIGLLVIIPLAVLFAFVLFWKKKVKKKLGDEELINRLTETYSSKNFTTKFLLLTAAIILCIIAAANFRSSKNGDNEKNTGIDVMVALDVSNSMLAQDVQPNRLERAKQLLNKLIEKLGDNRLGLVVFAGQAYLQMPLTADLSAAKMYVTNASPNAVPLQGTVVGDALTMCNASFNKQEKKYKAIILISDGEDHDIKTASAIAELQESGVTAYTVGIGSASGSPIFDPAANDYKKDENGNVVISKLNEKELQDIANQTSGEYYYFSNADEIANNILSQLNKMDKKAIGNGGHREYTTYFQWFILAAILLLLLEVIVPERKMKWV